MNRFHTVEDARGQEFYQLPKDLVKNPKYKKLTANSKIAYAVLKDRHSVSLKNKWIDEQGRVYFLFSDGELADLLDTSIRSTSRYKNELQEYGLIHMERQGLNRRNRIYLLKPESDIPYETSEEDNVYADRTILSSPDTTVLSSQEETILSSQERTVLSTLSNNNLSNNNLNKNDEEEYIYKLRSENVIFDFIFNSLTEKGLTKETIDSVIKLCEIQGLENVTVTDVEKQYSHMMRMKLRGENIYDFASYFVTGLKRLTEQTVASSLYKQQRAQNEKESAVKVVPFYDWLNVRE